MSTKADAPAGSLAYIQPSGTGGASYCIGVTQAAPGAPLQLQRINANQVTQQWIMGTDGYIYSNANHDLVMDPGTLLSNGASILLNGKLPGPNQTWNFSGSAGQIVSRSNPKFAVDNFGNSLQDGNRIVTWTTSSTDPAQQWTYSLA